MFDLWVILPVRSASICESLTGRVGFNGLLLGEQSSAPSLALVSNFLIVLFFSVPYRFLLLSLLLLVSLPRIHHRHQIAPPRASSQSIHPYGAKLLQGLELLSHRQLTWRCLLVLKAVFHRHTRSHLKDAASLLSLPLCCSSHCRCSIHL